MSNTESIDQSPHGPPDGELAHAIEIDVVLPALLQEYAEGQSIVRLKAKTLQGSFDALFDRYSLLRRHLFTETGEQRQHVLFFYNDENTKWLKSLNVPLKEGDTLTILQAVSGG